MLVQSLRRFHWRRRLSRILLVAAIALIFFCTKRDELKSDLAGAGANECKVDTKLLRTLDERIAKDTAFSGYVLDSPARVLCANRDNHLVYLMKASKIPKDSIEDEGTGYVGTYLNGQTNQQSRALSFFDANMIELSDSTWHPAIQLMSKPFVTIDSLEGTMMLIIKQRVSNGTLYHAVVDRYYRIDPSTLSLKYEFSIESISWVPIEEVYVRRIRQGKIVNVYASRDKDQRGDLIGKFELSSADAWARVNITVDEKRYDFLIETTSPRGEVAPPPR